MRKITAVATTMLFAAACGQAVPVVQTKGVTDAATATKAVGEVSRTMLTMSQGAMPARETVSGSVNVKIACDSGSATAKYTATASTEGGNVNATYEFNFNACKKGDKTVSGGLTWTFSAAQNPVKYTLEMNGAVAYEGPTYAGNFNFNSLKVIVAQENNETSITATGSYSVGGTTYEIDSSAGLSFLTGQ